MPTVEIDAQELDLLRQDVDRAIRDLKRLKKDIVNRMPDEFYKPRPPITMEFLKECVRKKYADDGDGKTDSSAPTQGVRAGIKAKGKP